MILIFIITKNYIYSRNNIELLLKNDILPFIYQKEKNDDDSNDNYSFDLITRRNIKFFNNIMINKII